jgi:hypothetical protein
VAGGAGNKKPTAVSSRGFLSKVFLTSTSANGVANDDDYYRYYLSNLSDHCELKIRERRPRVKLCWRQFIGQGVK